MSLVRIPLLLRRHTAGADRLELSASTAGECLVELERRYPGLSSELRDAEGLLRTSVNLYVNGQDVRYLAGLHTPLGDGDELTILVPIAGGTYQKSDVRC